MAQTPPPPLGCAERSPSPCRGGSATTPPQYGEEDHAKHGGGVFQAQPRAFRTAKRERRSGNLPEVMLWRALRQRPGGLKFRRQHPMGSYVLDFACLSRRVAIEVDGMAHDLGNRPQRDAKRDVWVEAQGFVLLRFAASSVLHNVDDVVAAIVAVCEAQFSLHPSAAPSGPSPRAGEVSA